MAGERLAQRCVGWGHLGKAVFCAGERPCCPHCFPLVAVSCRGGPSQVRMSPPTATSFREHSQQNGLKRALRVLPYDMKVSVEARK